MKDHLTLIANTYNSAFIIFFYRKNVKVINKIHIYNN